MSGFPSPLKSAAATDIVIASPVIIPPMFDFQITSKNSRARTGIFSTPHGDLLTPVFAPVGTQATVKGVSIDALRATGAQMVLANTYHLALRPGAELVRDLGGLHAFCGWSGPMLTDSGGFQIFNPGSPTERRRAPSHTMGTLDLDGRGELDFRLIEV